MSQIIIRKNNGEVIRKEIPKQQIEPPISRKINLLKGYEVSNNPSFTYRHQEVYFEHHGSPPKGWHIHHIDRDKLNNNIDNLIAIPEEVHEFIHYKMRQEKRNWNRLAVENELKAFLNNKIELEEAYRQLLNANKSIEKLKAQSKRWEIPEHETFNGKKSSPQKAFKNPKLKKKKKTTYGSILSSNGLVKCPKCQSENTRVQMSQRKSKESFKCFCQKLGCKNVQFVKKTLIPVQLKEKLRGEFNE